MRKGDWYLILVNTDTWEDVAVFRGSLAAAREGLKGYPPGAGYIRSRAWVKKHGVAGA